MIRISCTNCKTILSIDDAFAGGVCRCQHCGTIQTVPAAARGNATVAASGHSIGGSKTLYQNGEPQSPGTGLDDLASIVVSSGLASSRLKRSSNADEKNAAQNLLLPVLLGSGILVIILVFVIIYLLSHNSPGTTPSNTANPGQTPGTQTPVTTGPNFCGSPLTGNTVIYLLDHGQASQPFIGDLKTAVLRSAASLTADRKFAILFWSEPDKKVTAYPDNITTYATPDSIESARTAIDDVIGYGQPEITSALQQALTQHPDEIIIATGKGIDLNSAWVDDVLTLRGNSPVKIDTFNLGSGESPPLKRLAATTGGSYHEVSQGQLAVYSK